MNSLFSLLPQRWGYKPGWQLWLGQQAIIIFLLIVSYLLWLQGEWQQLQHGEDQQQQHHSKIVSLKQQLARLSPLETLQQQMAPLVAEEVEDTEETLEQRIAAPLTQIPIQVIGWQTKQNASHESQGALTFQASYGELLDFLQRVLALRPAVDIDSVVITAKEGKLNVALVLSQIAAEITRTENGSGGHTIPPLQPHPG